MYENLINTIKPLPKFNLEFYKEEDLYSEGEIEDVIIQMIAENPPEEYTKAIADQYCWSTYYHLTHIRRNLLNWYPFEKEASVLEIGCGMGAITAMLCDSCKEVTAVELSKKRATATLLRCREKENLEIIVGNLNDIYFEKKYDYITLIGVLEYQGNYTDTDNPYLDFIKNIRKLLKPQGRLLVAIENQYGLKYWCGAREDHTGIPFDGLNQYNVSKRKVRTFSKEALKCLLQEGGFPNTFFYYPMPDYKLPTVVYSQDYLPHNENMMNTRWYYTPDHSTLIAKEEAIYQDIIKNKVFDFFANSFLVECSAQGELGQVTFASLSSIRLPEYQMGTRILRNEKVEKFALNSEVGIAHLKEVFMNEKDIVNRGLSVNCNRLMKDVLETEYIETNTMEEVMLQAYREKNINLIWTLWDSLVNEIEKSSEHVSWEENILYTFDLDIEKNQDTYGTILKTGYIDMILRNAFWKEEQIIWFDQEWKLENVPSGFVLYRAFIQFYASFPYVNEVVTDTEFLEHYHLLDARKTYNLLEEMFIGVVIDPLSMAEWNELGGFNQEMCVNNIRELYTR